MSELTKEQLLHILSNASRYELEMYFGKFNTQELESIAEDEIGMDLENIGDG